MARRTLPSRLELNSPAGSSSAAPFGEGELHHVSVGLPRADDAVMLPNRHPAPLPGLDHLRSGALDERPDVGQRGASPVTQLFDPGVDELGGGGFGLSMFRVGHSFLHGYCSPPA